MFTADAAHRNGHSADGPRGRVVQVEDLAKRYAGRTALELVVADGLGSGAAEQLVVQARRSSASRYPRPVLRTGTASHANRASW